MIIHYAYIVLFINRQLFISLISFNPSRESGLFLEMEKQDHRGFKRLPLEFTYLEQRIQCKPRYFCYSCLITKCGYIVICKLWVVSSLGIDFP